MKPRHPCVALATVAIGLSLAGGALAKTRHEAPDAERMWQQFLAEARTRDVYGAFDVLDAVGYEGDAVDPARCERQETNLRAAVAAAPVSIAIRRAAYLCADARGDDAGAEREMEVLLALSRHALRQAGDPQTAAPIRVVAVRDASALVTSSGMAVRYEYYQQLRPGRYFPLVVVAWDDAAKAERRFYFDFLESAYATSRENEYHGFPALRGILADAFVEGGVDNDYLAAVDIASVRAAVLESDPADKVAKVRRAASAGGVQSAMHWLLVCGNSRQYRHCSDGLVEALLPFAEKRHAMHTMALAYAYFDGIGVKRDPGTALTLLDRADRRSRGEATVEFAALWHVIHGKQPLPAEIGKRLVRAAEAGHRSARLSLIERKLQADTPALDAAELAFLAEPAQNPLGLGYALLAQFHEALGHKQEVRAWAIKAAGRGHADSQAGYGAALVLGEDGIARDAARGRALLVEAAHGGNAWAARYLAHQSTLAGDFGAAEKWLLMPAQAGNVDAIMQLAGLYETGQADLSGNAERAAEIYGSLATAGREGAPARRALAAMAITGRGMAKDPAKALHWLRVDAEKGDHESEAMLGSYYLQGIAGTADEAEGERWMRRALKGNAEAAFADYGHWLFYVKNTGPSRARALELWSQGDAAGYASATNNYAWVLCTSPHDDAYDPRRGAEAARRLGDPELMSPAHLDTLAACHAAVGDFDRAVELQTRAAKQLAAYETEPARDDRSPGYERRLALYRAHQPYREGGEGEEAQAPNAAADHAGS